MRFSFLKVKPIPSILHMWKGKKSKKILKHGTRISSALPYNTKLLRSSILFIFSPDVLLSIPNKVPFTELRKKILAPFGGRPKFPILAFLTVGRFTAFDTKTQKTLYSSIRNWSTRFILIADDKKSGIVCAYGQGTEVELRAKTTLFNLQENTKKKYIFVKLTQ